LSKRFGISGCGNPHSNSRSEDCQGTDRESELIVAGTIKQVSGQEGADETTESAAAVGEAENHPKIPACKEVRRNRRQQGDSHTESKTGSGVDQQQREIVVEA
jgi:hypothetical protein